MATKSDLEVIVEQQKRRIAELEKASSARSGQSSATEARMLELLGQQQEQIALLSNLVQNNNGRPPEMPATASTSRRARRMELPMLASPTELTLAQFKEWQVRFKGYARGTLLHDADLETQHDVVRSALHSDWGRLWASGTLGVKDEDELQAVLEKLRQHLRSCRNPILDRVDFYRRKQGEGEDLQMYISALRLLLDTCGYKQKSGCAECKKFLEDHLQDRFVCGLTDDDTRQEVFKILFEELTLEKAVQSATAYQASRSTTGDLKKKSSSDTSNVCGMRSSYKKGQEDSKKKNEGKFRDGKKDKTAKGTMSDQPCTFCGRDTHPRESCPAKDAACRECGKRGHYARMCRQKSSKEETKDLGFLGALQNSEPEEERAAVSLHVGDSSFMVHWEADTGSGLCAVPASAIKGLSAIPWREGRPGKVRLANNSVVDCLGSFQAQLQAKGRTFETTVKVLESMPALLLSRQACRAFGLIPCDWVKRWNRGEWLAGLSTEPPGGPKDNVWKSPTPRNSDLGTRLREEFSDVFDCSMGLKTMAGPPMSIKLTEDAQPVKCMRARTIPYHWEAAVKEQVEDMVEKDIVERVPVGKTPDWIHPIVVVRKRGTNEPRITVNFTRLNKFLKRPPHPTATPRELAAKIPKGQKVFSKLDARHGYWQVELDEASRALTTFMTPWGMFRFKRNVMGLASAGDEFVRRGDDALHGVGNTAKVVEDILCHDENDDDHEVCMREVLQRCRQEGITLNGAKCDFGLSEVSWCGLRINSEGYTIDDGLVSGLRSFPVPKSKTDVRSFCGLINQFEPFSPDVASLSEPIRSLLPAKAAFVWEAPHQEAFEKTIQELTSPRVLTFFDPKCRRRLETDASRTGLGFALWQEEGSAWKLLSCGSRFVTDTESRYSVTELELLALVWAVEKCRNFLVGSHFEVIVDHKPLIPILNDKTLDQLSSTRLVRLREKLADHHFSTMWRAGCKHTVADVFSRHPTEARPDAGTVDVLQSVTEDELWDDPSMERLRVSAGADNEYQRLIQAVEAGLPASKAMLDVELHPYWAVRNDLATERGLVFCGDRVVVPRGERQRVLQALHSSHQGETRTLRRARQCVFWPGLPNQVRQVIQGCQQCAELGPSQVTEPLSWDKGAARAGEAIAADIFEHAGRHFLVIVDRYSGWPDVQVLPQISTSAVLSFLNTWFTAFGAPERITTDQGCQFTSSEFKEFCATWGIRHDTSAPYHARGNGLAESAVKAMKRLLKKVGWNGPTRPAGFQEALLEWRNTPREDGVSPAERVFGRALRTKVPHRLRQPDLEAADWKAAKLRQEAKARWDARARPLKDLRRGDIVRMQDPLTKKWDKIAEVIEAYPKANNYIVRTESRRVFPRNRKFLKPYFGNQNAPPSNSLPHEKARPKRERRPPVRFPN